MKEIAFHPGRFQPVVEIAQRDSGVPAPADTDFRGLEETTAATLSVAKAASRGFGSLVADPVPDARIAMIIGYVLAARNIVEQLLVIGVHTRVTTPLRSASLTLLEPIVRCYNYYGHFELDGKTYVTRDLPAALVNYLFRLRYYATEEVASGDKYTVRATLTFSDIDLDFYHLSPEGEIQFGKRKPLKDYILDLVAHITGLDLTPDARIVWLRYLLDVSTESSLTNFLRTARTLEGFSAPPRDTDDEPTAAHKAAMRKLFGKEFSTPGDTLPVSLFTGSITNAFNLCRRVTIERSYGMKAISLPKYEGGSAAQLAAYVDDVLVSQVPLSLSDSTAAVAFTTSHGVSRQYKSAPALEREELLRELVCSSLLPVR